MAVVQRLALHRRLSRGQLSAIRVGKNFVNFYLRRLHNHAIGIGRLPWPIIAAKNWPKLRSTSRRAITAEEHRKIVVNSPAPSRDFGISGVLDRADPLTIICADNASILMSAEPQNIDVLQNLELAVVNIWRKHCEMSDYVAARAYEAAFEHYRAEARGHQPKACALTGLDREVFDAVIEMCEFRLGRSKDPKSEVGEMPSLPVPELVDCLRQLRKSVERHRSGGRQGYLTFVAQFVR